MPEEDYSGPEDVQNEETLYRSVWLREECFYIDDAGTLRVAAQAFADSRKQPSLYRKSLCDDPPYSNPPRLGEDQSVVSLLAGKFGRPAFRIKAAAASLSNMWLT